MKGKSFSNIRLNKFHWSGKAAGKLGSSSIFIENAIPGEVVDVVNATKREGKFFAETSEVRTFSEYRTHPVCKHFGSCGGCNWQHISYAGQLKFKKQLLETALAKYGIKAFEIPEVIGSFKDFGYRYKLDYTFSARRWYEAWEGKVEDLADRVAFGFFKAENHEKIVRIEKCHLQPENAIEVATIAAEIANKTPEQFYDAKTMSGSLRGLSVRLTGLGQIMAVVTFKHEGNGFANEYLKEFSKKAINITSLYYCFADEPNKSWYNSELFLYENSEPFIEERANGLRFRISPQSFYQPNPLLAEKIFSTILEISGISDDDIVYDLYSGIGTISLTLAPHCKKMIGIEGSVQAVKNAIENAELNGLDNCTFIQGDVLETFTTEFIDMHGIPDLIVVDPPRAGLLIETKKRMVNTGARTIIYLSCNPLSLVYDLQMLTGKYAITYIQPFDQFAQTHHIETLVKLELNSNS